MLDEMPGVDLVDRVILPWPRTRPEVEGKIDAFEGAQVDAVESFALLLAAAEVQPQLRAFIL
jgi:hypothetical protein